MTTLPDQPGSDSRPQPGHVTSEPTTDPVETNDMTTDDHDQGLRNLSDPTADPTAGSSASTDPTGDPAATTEIPATSTQALPSAAPFRVEPSAPVPDDAVAPGSELPHLPPPTAATPPAAPAPHPAPQPAPRPVLVTVHKGPRPATVMLGLLTVLVAAYLLLANLTHASVGFAVSGPAFLGAFGGILLLVGLAGVVAGRLRRR